MPRNNRGRQRVEMVRMENESNLQVTFSKRRAGLFKKASELCTLCGAEIAVVVFSPGKKPFSFGHPNVAALINRFVDNTPPPQSTATEQIIEAFRANNVDNLNSEVSQLKEQEELLKKKRKEIKQAKESRETKWWETPINDMTKPQLQLYKAALEELKVRAANQAQALQATMQQNPHFNAHNFFAANQSSSYSTLPQSQLRFDPLGNNAGLTGPNVPGPSHDYNNHMNFSYDHGKFY